MWLNRRTLVGNLATFLLVSDQARAATIVDSVGRSVPVPARVERVFPADPPAAILLYTLAPELLLGWPRANRPQECVYMLKDICMRPEIGHITGRGNTANLETVLALKPDHPSPLRPHASRPERSGSRSWCSAVNIPRSGVRRRRRRALTHHHPMLPRNANPRSTAQIRATRCCDADVMPNPIWPVVLVEA
jgi:hypothetical protein